MPASNSLLNTVIEMCDNSRYLSKNKYPNHISYIYPICIIKIYSERIFVTYITDSGESEQDIVKISDFGYIRDILDIYSYTGHITSSDIH